MLWRESWLFGMEKQGAGVGERYGETVKGQVGRVWAACWNEKCSVGTCV